MRGEWIRCPICKRRYNVNDAAALSLHTDCQVRGAPQIDFEAAYQEAVLDELAGYPISKHLYVSDTRTGRRRVLTSALRRLIGRGVV